MKKFISNITVVLLFLTSSMIFSCTDSKKQEFIVPESWHTYCLYDNAFEISLPPTLEKRDTNGIYYQVMSNTGYELPESNNRIVFVPTGESDVINNATKKFCRVIITYVKGTSGDYYQCGDSPKLDNDDAQSLRELAYQESGEDNIIGYPVVNWIDVNDYKCANISYRRKSLGHGDAICNIYMLFNDDEAVMITVSFRETESQLWRDDCNNIINTFRWND